MTQQSVEAQQSDTRQKAVESALQSRRSYFSFGNMSAVYVFVALFLFFSVWSKTHGTFLTAGTWRTLVNAQALTILVALGFMIPLCAGAFDLAIGSMVGFSGVAVAKMLILGDKPPEDIGNGVPIVPAILIALAIGAAIGLISSLLIVKLHIDSFIATLGISSIIMSQTSNISKNRQLTGMPKAFTQLGKGELLYLQWPVWITLVLCIIVWYVLERTAIGRRVYATGGNREAARLAGVKVNTVTAGSLVIGAMFSSLAGVLWSAYLGVADPSTGRASLLPAAAAVFLGSTQFKGGRFNVWGMVIAVFTLATGVKGLQLAGGPVWLPDFFNGFAVLLAVGVAINRSRWQRTNAIRQALRLRRGEPSTATS